MIAPSVRGGESVIATALEWMTNALVGEISTSLGVLAIAALGFTMLAGRLSLRRGMTVFVGCFILFGAPAIASGLLGGARAADGTVGASTDLAPPIALPPATVLQPIEDPYAGASIVSQQPR